MFGPNFSLGAGLLGFGGEITLKSKLTDSVSDLKVSDACKLYLKLKGYEKLPVRCIESTNKEDKRKFYITLIDGDACLIQEGNPDFKPVDLDFEEFDRFRIRMMEELNANLQQAILEDFLSNATIDHLKKCLADL
jgi:hypothetical protein